MYRYTNRQGASGRRLQVPIIFKANKLNVFLSECQLASGCWGGSLQKQSQLNEDGSAQIRQHPAIYRCHGFSRRIDASNKAWHVTLATEICYQCEVLKVNLSRIQMFRCALMFWRSSELGTKDPAACYDGASWLASWAARAFADQDLSWVENQEFKWFQNLGLFVHIDYILVPLISRKQLGCTEK